MLGLNLGLKVCVVAGLCVRSQRKLLEDFQEVDRGHVWRELDEDEEVPVPEAVDHVGDEAVRHQVGTVTLEFVLADGVVCDDGQIVEEEDGQYDG